MKYFEILSEVVILFIKLIYKWKGIGFRRSKCIFKKGNFYYSILNVIYLGNVN